MNKRVQCCLLESRVAANKDNFGIDLRFVFAVIRDAYKFLLF